MGTDYYACDTEGMRWAHLDKAYDLFHAVTDAGLSLTEPVLTADFLTAYLAANPHDAYRIEPLLQWQREACGGRALSLWNEHSDDRPWRDWDAPTMKREGWTEDDPMEATRRTAALTEPPP